MQILQIIYCSCDLIGKIDKFSNDLKKFVTTFAGKISK